MLRFISVALILLSLALEACGGGSSSEPQGAVLSEDVEPTKAHPNQGLCKGRAPDKDQQKALDEVEVINGYSRIECWELRDSDGRFARFRALVLWQSDLGEPEVMRQITATIIKGDDGSWTTDDYFPALELTDEEKAKARASETAQAAQWTATAEAAPTVAHATSVAATAEARDQIAGSAPDLKVSVVEVIPNSQYFPLRPYVIELSIDNSSGPELTLGFDVVVERGGIEYTWTVERDCSASIYGFVLEAGETGVYSICPEIDPDEGFTSDNTRVRRLRVIFPPTDVVGQWIEIP